MIAYWHLKLKFKTFSIPIIFLIKSLIYQFGFPKVKTLHKNLPISVLIRISSVFAPYQLRINSESTPTRVGESAVLVRLCRARYILFFRGDFNSYFI